MYNLLCKKKESITFFALIMGLLFTKSPDFINVFLIIFVFANLILLLNCLKNIYIYQRNESYYY